jgi:acyl-CoA dehydrogenase
MMIYGQGAMRCHPYVLKEMYAANEADEEQSLRQFDSAVFGHIGFAISNFFRSVWFSITGARLAGSPYSDETAPYYRSMQRFSTNLAVLSDVSMAVLGGELKRRERISARLGDLLSYLYLASTVLKRFDDEGRQKDDLPLVHWAMQDCMFKLEVALEELLNNFPSKLLGKSLKLLVMPFGKSYKRPSDSLDHDIASILQSPCEARKRLGAGQYMSRTDKSLMGDLEQTLENVIASEPLYDKVCAAAKDNMPFTQLDKVADIGLELGVISEMEASLLRETEAGRLRTINVDDFDPAALVQSVTSAKPRAKRKAKAA